MKTEKMSKEFFKINFKINPRSEREGTTSVTEQRFEQNINSTDLKETSEERGQRSREKLSVVIILLCVCVCVHQRSSSETFC